MLDTDWVKFYLNRILTEDLEEGAADLLAYNAKLKNFNIIMEVQYVLFRKSE